MDYNEALKYIHGTYKMGSKLGLENMRRLLDILGNPHKGMKYIHVAGTNGKGSTVSYIGRILIEAGYKVGRYTSPYLERFEERIAVNENYIGGGELGNITEQVKNAVEMMVEMGDNHPTEFEIVTAIGFVYFRQMACDVVVLEVGLGGRYDATNIIESSVLSVITSISRDHIKILGETLEAIAFEKAGIIKPGGRLLLYPQEKCVERVIADVCREMGASLTIPDLSGINVVERDIERQVFNYGNYNSLEISLAGLHQPKNAAIAVTAAEMLVQSGFRIHERHIRDGLRNARWPGRMEVINRRPLVIIDGAHNEDASQMLARSLGEYFPDRGLIFIFGALQGKDYLSMLKNTAPLARAILTVTADESKGIPASILAEEAKNYCNNVMVSDTIRGAILKSLEISGENDVICAFGSLYFIGEIREYFRK